MKIFLDANIIADWILIKNKAQEVTDETEDNVLTERYRYMGYSYKLIEKIRSLGLKAYTSQLSIAEVFSVIYDDVINLKLFMKAIPTAAWNWLSIREKELLDDEEAYEIYEGILERFDELFLNVEIVDEVLDLELLSHLILKLGLRTHDALLLTTAILNGMDYFVTRDERLIRKTRKLKKMPKIVILRPQSLLSKIG
ncbi:MAG: hypothetical protein DRO98_04190 [Archaeoglobales archaeon]|nr:MAG: hypothetical protein DRO98_04190 [Archaeoglobales archaeon]